MKATTLLAWVLAACLCALAAVIPLIAEYVHAHGPAWICATDGVALRLSAVFLGSLLVVVGLTIVIHRKT